MEQKTKKGRFLTARLNRVKITGSILVIAAFFFSFGYNAQAITADQSQTADNATLDWGWNYLSWSALGQVFTAGQPTISGVNLKICRNNTYTATNGTSFRIYLFDGDVASSTINTLDAIGSRFVYYNQGVNDLIPACGTPADVQFLMETVSLTVGNKYTLILLQETYTGGNMSKSAYQNTNVYAGGEMVNTDYLSDRSVARVDNNDLYFETLYNDQEFIQPESPDSGDNFTNRYVNFTGSYYNTSSTTPYDALEIEIHNTAENYDLFGELTPIDSVGDFSIQKYLNAGSYTWTGYLKQLSTGSTTISFAPIAFTVGATSTAITGFCSASVPCSELDTSLFFGGILCGLKRASAWAICPTQFGISRISDSATALQQSFPFTTFFQLTDTVKQAIASTSTSTADTLGVPMIRQTATGSDFYILPVLSSSSMPAVIGETNTALFRNGIGWLLWLGAGVLVAITIF